ncbi:hypothetical protein [Nitrosospira briensis]|uniref:hypothetical protein n=1 Tax=Nitrosospira briensis TaxID=35799 RepID=UPI00046B0A19|nr:hypothetical protein [Nitrosospira briensis]
MINIEWNALILMLAGNVVPTLIGGGLTLAGVCLAHRFQKKEAAERDNEHVRGLLQAFHDEIQTLWEIYKAGAGADIVALANNEPMLSHWPLTQDYFTIYNTNASSIGKIKNQELRRQIITTYTKARTMIDSIRLNNDLLHKLEHDCFLFRETPSPANESNASASRNALVGYATALKQSHSELELAASKLESLWPSSQE